MQPAVSVVILSHRKEFLPDALQSVLNQTIENIQIIVQYCPANWPTKLNEAMQYVRGEFFVCLCDDDLLDKDFLLHTLAAGQKGGDIVYTDRMVFEDRAHPETGIHFHIHGEEFTENAYWMQMAPEDFRFGSSLPMTCLIRTAHWKAIGGFDPHMPHHETEFWYRSVAAGGKHGYIPKPLFLYHMHAGQYHKESDQSMAFLKAFHRKHFQAFGVMMGNAKLLEDGQTQVDTLPPDDRIALLATGWRPDW